MHIQIVHILVLIGLLATKLLKNGGYFIKGALLGRTLN